VDKFKVKCVACGHEKEIPPQPEQPLCEKCGSPMILAEAIGDALKG